MANFLLKAPDALFTSCTQAQALQVRSSCPSCVCGMCKHLQELHCGLCKYAAYVRCEASAGACRRLCHAATAVKELSGVLLFVSITYSWCTDS